MAKQVKVVDALKQVKTLLPWKRMIIHGREGYLTSQFLKKLSSVVSLEKFSADEELGLFLNFSGTSLFGGLTVPVLTQVEFLPSKLRKKTDREKLLSTLKRFETWVLVSFEELDYKKLSSELFKGIFNLADVVIVSEPYSERALYTLLAKKFASSGKKVSQEVIKLIVEFVGTDLQNLKQETDKLVAYPGEITEEVVKELVFSVGNVNVFEIIFSYVAGEKKRFLREVSAYFDSGGDGLMLLGLLQSQMRIILELKSGKGVKVPKKVLGKFKKVASSYSYPYLLKLLRKLHDAEFSIKAGVLSAEDALKGLITADE